MVLSFLPRPTAKSGARRRRRRRRRRVDFSRKGRGKKTLVPPSSPSLTDSSPGSGEGGRDLLLMDELFLSSRGKATQMSRVLHFFFVK